MKLNETQQDVLRRMANGARLLFDEKRFCWYLDDPDRDLISSIIIWELLQKGAIECVRERPNWFAAEHGVTPAGCEALGEERDE